MPAAFAGNSLKAFGALIVLCVAAGTAYYGYAVTSATPWLNPNAANPASRIRGSPAGRNGTAELYP